MTLLLLLACTTATDNNFTGKAAYRDAPTDSSGSAKEAQPVAREDGGDQSIQFTSSFEGNGTFGDLTDICLPADGSFTGTSSSEGAIDSDGNFSGEVSAAGSGSVLKSTLGCVTSDLDIDALTSITIVAFIEADSENCTYYCESNARAECESDSDRAACEADLAASCEEECTTEHTSILAEITIDGGASLEGINNGMDGEVFGAFTSELTFDTLD